MSTRSSTRSNTAIIENSSCSTRIREEEHNNNNQAVVKQEREVSPDHPDTVISAEDSSMTQQPVVPKEPHVGQRVARMFVPEHNTQKPQLYFGRVVEFWANKEGGNEELWRIQYNDGDEEDLNAKEIAKALKQGKPVPLNSVGIEFAHFVHARMIKWLIRYPKRVSAETFYDEVPKESFKSDKLSWKIFDCATSGNAYRHLDSGTSSRWSDFEKKTGIKGEPATWTEDQRVSALIFALTKMIGILPHVIRKLFPNWKHLDVEACYPSSVEELRVIAKNLRKLMSKQVVFTSAYQTQGSRWANYFPKWTFQRLKSTCARLQESVTWKIAVNHIISLPGMGDYYGTQGLCDFYFGIIRERPGFFKHNEQVKATMFDATGFGNGPRSSLSKIFPDVSPANALVILTHSMDAAFESEGLQFPYLKNSDGSRRRLSCVDIEHTLCYFHRYLEAKKHWSKKAIDEYYQEKQRHPGKLPTIKAFRMMGGKGKR